MLTLTHLCDRCPHTLSAQRLLSCLSLLLKDKRQTRYSTYLQLHSHTHIWWDVCYKNLHFLSHSIFQNQKTCKQMFFRIFQNNVDWDFFYIINVIANFVKAPQNVSDHKHLNKSETFKNINNTWSPQRAFFSCPGDDVDKTLRCTLTSWWRLITARARQQPLFVCLLFTLDLCDLLSVLRALQRLHSPHTPKPHPWETLAKSHSWLRTCLSENPHYWLAGVRTLLFDLPLLNRLLKQLMGGMGGAGCGVWRGVYPPPSLPCHLKGG